MVGTLFPLVSYDNCMDSVETPKTVALHVKIKTNTPKSNNIIVIFIINHDRDK